MNNKEVFLFDENAAIKKLDSKTKLTNEDNEKKISSDLKTPDLKENESSKNEVVNNDIENKSSKNKEVNKDIENEKKESYNSIIDDIDDPFFFS